MKHHAVTSEKVQWKALGQMVEILTLLTGYRP